MPTLKLTHDEHQMLLDIFASLADLGDIPNLNDEDNWKKFDKLWDKVIAAK